MTAPAIDLHAARTTLVAAAKQLADLLQGLDDTHARIPGSSWTVGDAMAHVIMDLRTEALVSAGQEVSWADGATATPGTPGGIAQLNARAITVEQERDAKVLAALLMDATTGFVTASALLPADHAMPSPYFQGEMALDLAAVTCVDIGEVVVHGHDIATATGRPWRIPAESAQLAVRGALRLIPAYLDPSAAGHRGSYDLRVRRGPHVVIRIADGAVALTEPDGRPVDCHISADPVGFLLVMYGRRSVRSAILRGQMLGWGRRAWIAPGLKRRFRNP
jgi:uncharacterized protein (TIGR03083 family)